jgi:hypothetical protein
MSPEVANRRNRGAAAFRAYAARMGHATDHWLLMSEAEIEAWCCAADAAIGYGFQPTPGFAGNTCCAGTVMLGAVALSIGGGGAAAGEGVPFMVGGGGAGGAVEPMTSGSGTFPTGAGPR